MTESCDIVVIGGGPGGSACATLLADQGYRVTLLERAKFPREHVGESLLPASIPVLEQIGAMPAIEAAGFVVKRGATLVWGKDPEPWSWYFADDPGQRPTSFQVVRSEFDHILLKNAAEHGVDVREEHQVLDIEFDADDADRVTGVTYLHDGESGRIDCRFLVDASGQAALLSRKLGLHQWDEYFKNLAVYGYYQDAKHLDPPNNGNIFIESYEHGWLWKIPLHTGVTSVGAVVDKEIGQQGLRELGRPRIPRSPGRPRAAHAESCSAKRRWSTIPASSAIGPTHRNSSPATATCSSATPPASSIRSFPPACISPWAARRWPPTTSSRRSKSRAPATRRRNSTSRSIASSTTTSISPPSSSTGPTAAPTPTSGKPAAFSARTTRPRERHSCGSSVGSRRRDTSAP